MTDFYTMPIANRVGPFLLEKADNNTWYTAAAIAGETHLVAWQVEAQLNEMAKDNKVTFKIDKGMMLYRLAVPAEA